VSGAATGAGRAALLSHLGGCLVATVLDDLDGEQLAAFRDNLLGAVRDRRPQGVVLDVSALDLIDPHDFAEIKSTLAMLALLGARPVLVGLRPALIAALLELAVDVGGVVAEHELAAGIERSLRAA
jgi:anti-anti-sigma regulatory factor